MPVSASLRACAAVTLGAWFAAAPLTGQSGARNGEWPTYGGDLGNTRYAPLDQITRDNFNDLEIAWRFKTDSLGPRPEYNFQSTPLMVNGRLYTTAGSRRAVVSLDAGHGGDAVDAQRARRRARRGGAAAAVRPRAGVLERREGRADPLRDTGLPPDRARREDRRPGFELRHARRRGPEAGQRPGDRPRHRRGGTAGRPRGCREHDHHRGGAPGELRAEEQDERQGLRAGLRRADRQAVLDLPHDSAPR